MKDQNSKNADSNLKKIKYKLTKKKEMQHPIHIKQTLKLTLIREKKYNLFVYFQTENEKNQNELVNIIYT